MINISQDSSLYDNPPFVCIYKNLFHLAIIRSLSYSSFVLFSIIDLILYTNWYFDTKYNEL